MSTPRSRRGAGASDRHPLEACANALKALGDPLRLEIVSLVARAGEPLCACEIEAHFERAQSTISHHLGLLRKAGILDAERRGTWNFYTVSSSSTAALESALDILRR